MKTRSKSFASVQALLLVALVAAPFSAGTSASAFTTNGMSVAPAAPTIEIGSGSPELTFTIEKKHDYDFHSATFTLAWAGSINWTLPPTCPQGEANATADLSLCGISSFVATSTDGPMPNPLPVEVYSDAGELKMIFEAGWQSSWTAMRDTTYTLVLAEDAYTVTDFGSQLDETRLDIDFEWCSTRHPIGGVNCSGASVNGYYSRFRFDANGGTGTMPNVLVAEGSALPPNVFVKPGFEFAGWAASKAAADACAIYPQSYCLADEWITNGRFVGTLYAIWSVAGSGPTPPTLPTWSASEDVSLPLANA
jgi:hypothetical protein